MLINQAELDMQQAAAPKVSFVSLGCPKALVDPGAHHHPAARRRL